MPSKVQSVDWELRPFDLMADDFRRLRSSSVKRSRFLVQDMAMRLIHDTNNDVSVLLIENEIVKI